MWLYPALLVRFLGRDAYWKKFHFLNSNKCSLIDTNTIKHGISKKMQKLKRILIRLNNGYLTKHQIFIKDTSRTLPYLVNNKLKPKKKQPEFVKNKKELHENADGGINGIEYSLMPHWEV